jgi:hypothetical protein
VHGQIGPTVQQGFLDFLDEQPLAADLGQGHVQDLVAGGLDQQQFHRRARVVGLDAVLDVVRLPQGEPAAPGGDGYLVHPVLILKEI